MEDDLLHLVSPDLPSLLRVAGHLALPLVTYYTVESVWIYGWWSLQICLVFLRVARHLALPLVTYTRESGYIILWMKDDLLILDLDLARSLQISAFSSSKTLGPTPSVIVGLIRPCETHIASCI